VVGLGLIPPLPVSVPAVVPELFPSVLVHFQFCSVSQDALGDGDAVGVSDGLGADADGEALCEGVTEGVGLGLDTPLP
jgi:hypothetical protein